MINGNELLKLRARFQKEFAPYMDYIVNHYINFYVCGSKSYPFIRKPHDLDIVVTCPNPNDREDLEPLNRAISRIKKELGCDIIRACESDPNIYMWLYGRDLINILGSDEIHCDLFARGDRMLPLIERHYKRYMKIGNPKRMYDIIYYYYITKNGGYFLTDEQARDVERWHDGYHDWDFLRSVIDELGLEWLEPHQPNNIR